MENLIGKQVKIIKDGLEGFYDDLVGQAVTVVEDHAEDDEITFFTVITGRPTKNPYLDKYEELIHADDIEIIPEKEVVN